MFTQNENGTLTHKATGQILEAMSPFALMEAIRVFHEQEQCREQFILELQDEMRAAKAVKKDTIDELPSMNMTFFPLGGSRIGAYLPPPMPGNTLYDA